MADQNTIEFVPNRLNMAPIVFRGMTGREVMLVGTLSAAIGIGPGLIGWLVWGYFAMVPTAMAVTAGSVVWWGGLIMRRLRRGRPESWLYRRIQWLLAHYRLANKADLIVDTARFEARRRRLHDTGEPS